MRPTYEPIPEGEKGSVEHLVDYDMSIGSSIFEQDGQTMVSEVDKWFEEAFGPLPKEDETVVETTKPFELSNEADLSGFHVKDLMDKDQLPPTEVGGLFLSSVVKRLKADSLPKDSVLQPYTFYTVT